MLAGQVSNPVSSLTNPLIKFFKSNPEKNGTSRPGRQYFLTIKIFPPGSPSNSNVSLSFEEQFNRTCLPVYLPKAWQACYQTLLFATLPTSLNAGSATAGQNIISKTFLNQQKQ